MSKWEMVKLGDILEKEPKSKIKAGEGLLDGEYKFFTSSNTQTKFINECNYAGPSLIFGTGGSASIHYCDESFSTSTDCLVFTSNNSHVLLQLIYLYFTGNMFLLENGFKGAGLKHISKDYILGIEIPLPPLEEQKKIARELDKIASLIEKRKEQIEKLDLLIKAKFVEMFGDSMKNEDREESDTIRSLGSIAEYSKTRIEADKITYENYIGVDNLLHNYKGKKISNYTPIEGKFTCYEINDILIGNIRPYLKKAWLSDRRGGASGDVLVIRIKPKEKKYVNPNYLFQALKDDYFVNYIMKSSKGAKMPRGDKNMIIKYKIYIPPIDLQNQFADYVEKVESTKENLQKSLEQLEVLYKQRMQHYFE